MARVEVRQLRYKGEPAKAGRVEFAVADALRTEVVDDGRLVLVRSFRLGRIGLTERGASQAAASAWRTLRDGARHGGTSGAESANCVWFADAAEARMMLLRELASGRTPFGWFWALAVPDWRRETLPQWLDRRLREAAGDASGETVAALVAEAIAADCVEPLATAILAQIPTPSIGGSLPKPREGQIGQSSASEKLRPRALRSVEEAKDEAVASRVERSIPPALRVILAAISARTELAAFVETLVRGLVRRAHPALVLAPARLRAIAATVADILRAGEAAGLSEPGSPLAVSGDTAANGQEAAPDDLRPETGPAPPLVRPGQSPLEGAVPIAEPLSAQPREPLDPRHVEVHSLAAGLFLAIVPLVRLGWREWLADRPHLLLHQPGPRLLRRLATHYRVPAHDPVWSLIPQVDPAEDSPPELEQALHLWRAGLDGWLRRKARLRLADLVLRRGWILPGVETTLVRFPLQAIEIRLRRLALDGDPGWVDWLGHSYRVVYRDRPLLGPELA